MAINVNLAQLQALVGQSVVESAVVAYVDAVYHDQHGDSLKWTDFEWESYHRAIEVALSRFRGSSSV